MKKGTSYNPKILQKLQNRTGIKCLALWHSSKIKQPSKSFPPHHLISWSKRLDCLEPENGKQIVINILLISKGLNITDSHPCGGDTLKSL